MKLIASVALTFVVLSGCGLGRMENRIASGPTEQQAIAALKKLHFMQGGWNCVVRGGPGNGYVSRLTYSFSPDGFWMVESEVGARKSPSGWSTQLWGYDITQPGFSAYQFTPVGVFTKSVRGWENGEFVSTRDDNHAVVSIRKHSNRAFDWVIRAAGQSSAVIEACKR